MIIISAITSACTTTLNKKNNTNYIDYDNDTNYLQKLNRQNTQIIHKKLNIQELKVNNTIYFDLNQYDITHQFFNILNNHADFLRNHPSNSIRIEGHTDERGTAEYNIALGERRANAVKLYLQSQGVLHEQISTVSYGREKPAMHGHNETAYSKNRRAVLIYNKTP
ncbi:peptidoglycan-associated lipoprotein Pal [Candidatus Blochmannia ocreatus (nom. nud.)]|uniref:Peptidoglycan-associated protein n=1 Tax=Candidatus Blochmannia ocreatus (nom. nud.) TaxID=251538 RepID=A0ABY4SZZ7_9ENTR|nr:peptidoglycan-associated lipoprotein Pal [Candidatus Blochmannia ocreatus]URJ25399.1 peptidoglycan-associated lipoprotein Pal [Candidatus Blochmannia ocreatus]